MKKIIMQAVFLIIAVQAPVLAEVENQEYSIKYNNQVIKFNPKHNREIYFYQAGTQVKRCILNGQGADRFLLSHDKSAVIISDNGYIPLQEMLNCNDAIYLQEKKVHFAVLADVNFFKKIYVSIHILETAPQFLCNATVAKIGTTKNLITLPGADIRGWSQRKLRGSAFLCPDKSYISPEGQYVAVREIDCDEFAHPGVWDTRNNKKVVFSSKQYSVEEIQTKCKALFEIVGGIE